MSQVRTLSFRPFPNGGGGNAFTVHWPLSLVCGNGFLVENIYKGVEKQMLKRFTALSFSIVLMLIWLMPCSAQTAENDVTQAVVTTVEAAEEASADEAAVEEVTADEAAEEEKAEETSSGIPMPTKKTNTETESKKGFFASLAYNFEKTFIRDNRWTLFLEGFRNTVLIALCSTILGVIIGMVIAVVKVLHSQIDRPNIIISILNFIFNIYTTVIRGTPAVVQLFIAYYIIFKTSDNYIVVSIFAFGINSGAYVSEIVRGGILSIDRGQLEAGRSLGLSYIQTMINIVLPQAIKNILPALGNEFILLLKDTSIAGYIGTLDLMKAGNIVRSRTFEPYFSLLSVAAIYLVCVILLEQLVKYFERRMARSDRH